MRTEWATTGALLLVLASTVLQVSAAGDIYLEGEEDNLNEFLEVREDDTSVFSHLKRFKRQFSFPDFGSFFNREEDSAAKDSDDGYGKDDDVDNFGSGSADKADPDSREKTLRVTFTANEPYLKSYSDRDSLEFRDFSQTLASAVDKLYDSLPGTQRTSLVRIQSHISDEFSCKVTLDIVTSGYEDIENIKNLLRNHIKTSHRLGKTIVSESDFSAQLIDPGTTFCEENEFKCDEYHCLPLSVKCNGQPDCNDGKDEENCPITSNPIYPENGQQTESYPEYPETNNNTYTNGLYNQPNPDQNPETLNPADPNSYDQESLKPAPYDPNLPNYDQSTDDPYYNPEDNYDQKNQYPGNDDQNPSNPDTDDQTSQGPDRNDPDGLNRKTEETPYYVFTTEASKDREPERGDGGRLDETDIPTRAPEETSYTSVSRDPYESAPGSSQVETTTPRNEYTDYDRYVCPPEYIRCDHTRCIEKRQRCDGQTDCDDGTDEANCPELLCGADDFRCDNGNCIELSKRCDRIVDCPNQEDELDCDCRPDEFRCESDGNCIERRRVCDRNQDCSDGSDERDCVSRLMSWSGHHACPRTGRFKCSDGTCISILLRCDGFKDCKKDGSDEIGCPCGSDQWQCDHGSCIKRKFRCDGRVDCPTDRSDERNCVARGYFKCKSGHQIPEYLRCNRQYDCPLHDYSDEQNCPCGANDFRCDNGHCIPESKHCDRTHDCQDRSDERYCTYGTVCMAYEYECKSGMCVQAEARCNGTVECNDDSDEAGCTCKRGQYSCRDGSCINIALLCNGHNDCSTGEDEYNCKEACPPDQFSCPGGGCAYKCNGDTECSGGEDEENCPDCAVQCDGKCIPAHQICDRRQDCSDGSDEVGCDFCNRPDDFSCGSGECIANSLKCNGVSECSDGSDEKDCDSIMVPNNGACGVDQFQCVTSSECIDKHFYCDGRQDCIDNSDEAQDCHCPPDSWQCHSTSQCIPTSKYCDGLTDCSDGSDETNCSVTTQRPYVVPPRVTPTTPNYYTTSAPSFYPGSDSNLYQGACNAQQWRCENGPCIDAFRRCDGHIDCPFDFSDEFDCPPNSPVALNLKTYPNQETVRYVSAGGDVVLQCRDEGPERARVKWHKERGYIKDGSTDVRGRLELFHVTDIDSGVYVCEAEDYSQYPGAQVKVSVIVGSAPTTYRPFQGCQPNEATCGNGQCIPKSAVCNNNIDCADGSDEENCHHSGICEPNEFKCNNGKCVLKTWICDSEDDCGDNSDEQNCGARENGKCSPVEFACQSQNQCIPKSFHCDLQTDCFDGTDEIGCVPVYVKSPPKPQNVKLNPGDTLTLRCEAVGVPVPLISWRLNWGHVPAKCTWTSDNGVGELVCPNMQPDDSGAYSCEAMNNKGTTFATPDAIVFVNKTDLCPRGYFNNEARTERECIRCFCFGKSTQCHSADLFTYNMPTPLGEGGTRLIGIKPSTSGDVNIDSQLITNQYFYQPLRNGATVTKFDDGNYPSNSNPYIIVPETYNGNQLKSYGGHIKYTLSPHASDKNYDDTAATIIIKGKYGSLFHINRFGGTPDINVEASLTPSGWFKYADGSVSATREDIMMVLNDIELILLRADLNNAGVNITDFVMESADHINVGLGAANLVEECTCPKGYEGLSCQKCASGFQRKKVGPWLGDCEPEECPPGTYGDPSSGLDCRPCPCPLTNRENQFARTCSLGSDGSVICDCFQGYQGGHCEVCAPGYEGNPLIPGDSCRPKQISRCDPVGTKSIRPPDECVCKDNVQGRYCDQCKSETFFLSSDFRHGCADCFCSGITQQCTSSNYRRETISVQFNVPQIVDQVRVYSSAPAGRSSVRYSVPKETDLRLELHRGEVVTLNNVESSAQSSVYYWSLPPSFAGDKVTSYGGNLQYVLKNVPSSIDPRYRNTAADVQLISDNKLIFHYFGDFDISHEGILNASINLLEKGWQRPDGNEVTRAQFLLALADVKTILIKATYSSGPQLASPVSASIEIAKENAYGPIASQVEQCNCPQGYVGTSCEDCMPGYTRNKDLSGLYLGQCDPCQCNNKSNMCHPETGKCYECSDNSAGDKCEFCKPGYERDPYGNCSPVENPLTCSCDPRGTIGPCDNSGKCNCKQNVEGDSCDRCRPGTFGLDANNPDGCLPCYCSGVTTDCHEGSHYNRVPIAAPILGENYGGYTITDLNADQVIKDNFIPLFEQSELMYNFQFHPDVDYYWSLPIFPGNRVLSYGGSLSLRQKFSSASDKRSERGNDVVLDGGDIRIFWTNPNQFPSETSYSYQVPLKEEGWFILNTATPATHSDFMTVLRNLKRVLVRATVAPDIYVTTIADVSMDTAAPNVDPILPAAKGIEICMNCPAGYSGTSCESCNPGYYKDERGYCRSCPCNGHDCQLDSYGQLVCNCKAPYTGNNCGIIGLIMELHPTIQEPAVIDNKPLLLKVTFTCKYRGPEPLTIKFYHEGQEQKPVKYFNESKMEKDGWHGEHIWHTIWDTRRQGEIYECHTITEKGFTLGVLTTSLPEPGGSSVTDPTVYPPVTRKPPPEATVFVTIDSPTIQILEVGSSVSFTCTAQSRNTRERLPINWTKKDGHLPRERTQIDEYYGTLQITNLQVSDSGVYICETNDGINTAQAKTTLKVPGNEMTQPTVEISPSVKEYYEGELVELECKVSGNPTPTIRWQRGSNRPLPLFAENRGNLLIIERASVDDSGEYRCIASNAVGSDDRTAMITVRPRPQQPPLEKLTVSNTSPNVDEGRSVRIVCTGSTNVPAGSIDWVRQDNAEFTSNVRSENGVLNIDFAVPENQGVYICRSPVSNVAPVQILLTVILKNAVPDEYKISTSVDSLKIPTGGSGTVDCTVTGRPAPLVKWTRTDGPFGPGTSQRGNTLIISDAQASDNGYYLCTGSVNGAPVVYSYVYVDIERREAPKVMIWPEGEQAVILGGQYELQCRVLSGTPEPYVTWNRNGGRSLSPFTQLQPQNVLRFNEIEVNDEGEYTCTASNAAGSASASAVIKVRSLPEITISPAPNSQNNIEINNGDPLNVECRATGFPEPLVSISFNNYEIVPAQPSHASLRVPSATYNNEGSYTCTATSAAGTAASQFAVLVERGDGADDGGEEIPNYDGNGDNTIDPYDTTDTLPGSNEVPANLYAIEGQTETVIYCNQSGNGKVVWTRGDSQPIEGNVRQSDSRLIILNVSKRDSGSYVCNIYNEYDELQHAIYTSLVVVTAPLIILRPPVQTVQPGQSPTVECLAVGDDLLDVTWRPYNKYPSSRMEIRKNMLIFHEIEVEDAGQYECIATSPHANTTAIAKVVVNEDSDRSWTSHANEQWAHAGAAVHLQCNVTQPDTNVVWTKDARALPRSVTRKSDGSLFIRLAHKSDTGRYICSIQDKYGRTITSNYIDLHIQGYECLKTEFRCYDQSACVDEHLLCDGRKHCQDNSDEENCLWRDKRFSDTLMKSLGHHGPRVSQPEQLVYIEPPSRPFRVGDNVNVLCKNRPGDISVQWIRPGTNEYVDSIPYGDGAMLSIQRVTYADAGIYRCYGRDARLGRDSYDDFELVVESGPDNPGYSDRDNIHVAEYSARLRDSVDLPCQHNLEPPVNIEWKKEYSRLPAEFRTNQPNLHLEMVTEADAGTYVCRVSNSYVTAEARAILTVKGVIPMFNGNSYIALPSLTEAYRQFDIEISFKTTDNNGLILYNSQEESPSGDYLALQLKDGVPEFILNTGNEPIKKVSSDRPMQLNTWHTIRLSRTASKVTMDVDNIGPFIAESGQWALLELKNQPLYIGGVRDYDQLPVDLAGASGFIGCVSMLILGTKEINIMLDSIDQYGIADCNSCNPNLCQNNGFCQEAHNERGYQCICATGFAGLDCDRTGEACHPGLCGPGKCTDTNTGYKCACPVTHTGTNCETKQSIEYPAFTGSAFLAIKQPDATRSLTMSMNIKAATPVTDGIIMYCAESPRGYGGFTSLTVHNGRLEFRFDLGKGSSPVILVSNKTLPDNAWTKVQISRIGAMVSLKIDNVHSYEQSLPSPFSNQDFIPKTPIFVGGVDDSITLNKNVGVIGGFNGCIKDFTMRGQAVDIVNETIKSANVQECVTYVRGDIPEDEKLVQCQCRNGGRCISESEPTVCSCTPGFTGQLCEERAPSSMRERSYTNPCNTSPCQNGGTCRPDFFSRMNYTCDCPLGHAGDICQIELRLYQSVGFNGNGYLELPASALTYNLPLEPTIIAMAIHTTRDGVLLYQLEGLPNYADYILLRIERGIVVLEWDMGSGRSVISINEEIVTDGERHQIIAKLLEDGGALLSVDSHQRTGRSTGISGIMNVDSNIYIGGIPEQINPEGYPGFTGCVAQLELMDLNRGLNLGEVAVAGRNTQRCKKF